MITFNAEQFAAITVAAKRTGTPLFVRHWLDKYLPYVLEGLTEAQIEVRVRYCADRAIAWDMTSDRALAAVVVGMFLISPSFGRLPSFARLLEDPTLTEDQKLKALESRDAAPSWAKAGKLNKRWPGDAA